jgi:isoprenylcysteine carboxyl methyltransferase (ICMT) family protein YpbQ
MKSGKESTMGFVISLLKWVILIAAAYYLFKIVRTLIREPNLRMYLVHTAKEAKNMYYRYHV